MKRFLTGCLVGALGAVVAVGVPIAQAQNNGNTVQAPFMVLGASGQPILSVDDAAGYPELVLYGGTGKGAAVKLAVKNGFAGIQIISQNGDSVAALSSDPTAGGAGAVKVADGAGELVAFMQGAPIAGGAVGVKLHGQDVVRLEQNSGATGGKLSVGDTNGHVAVQVGLLSNGAGGVCIYDSKGQHC